MKTKMLFQCLLLIVICGFAASAIPIKAEKWKPIKAVNLSDDHWGKSNEALMGDFPCSAGEITFANFAFATINVCTINVPASVEMQVEGQEMSTVDGTIINYIYLLTDEDDIILSSSEGNVIETSDLAVGNYRIYGFIYAGELTGNTPGQNVFWLEAEECEAWSDYLEIRVKTCDSPNCQELESDFFSFCDDGNANTTTDLINLDCQCVGTCEVIADGILFPGESTSEVVCFNDDQPTFLSLLFNSSGTGADGYIIISDPFGDFLLIESLVSSIDNVDFNQFGAGSVFIQVVSYEQEFTNADELAIAFNENGTAANLADISGCAELSNSLEVQGILCAIVIDCPVFDANIGDPCDDMNPATENDVITDECGCEGELVQTYDCDELMADFGDPCNDMNPATENDVITDECGCEGELVQTYECDELMADFGDPCDDMNPETVFDIITDECECLGLPSSDCDFTSAPIEFYDPENLLAELPFSQNFCALDGIPSFAFVRPAGDSGAPNQHYVITDEFGNYLDILSGPGPLSTFDLDQYGVETVFIQVVQFYSSYSNASQLRLSFLVSGTPTNLSDLDGCFSVSNQLEMVGQDCGALDCPELAANFGDTCDDLNDNTENDMVNEVCECEGEPVITYDCPLLEANAGDPCDDGNPLTNNDTVSENCECIGTPDLVDCPSLMANIGDPCDDGTAATFNDIIGPACECIGTPVDCTNLLLNIGDPCDDGNPLTNNDTVSEICQCTGTPDLVDCTNLLLNIGDPCDDGNPLTNNDTVSENCQCTGTPDLVDCPSLMANIGDPCDDGDENTIFDEIDENCECSGITVVIVDCVELMANVGDTCDDGNPATQNDVINSDCECVGEPFDLVDCIEFAANFGDPCDDGNPATQNDVINNNCECAGEPFDLVDCIEFAANFGDPCDDGNPATQNDVINNNCECAGEPFDLVDCIEFAANIGDPCDDGNPETLSDVITAACTCEGEIQEESCANFAYYLSDVANDGTTVIYGVELDELSLEATLHFLKEFAYEAHIAFNETDGLMYVVRTSNGAFRTLDVSVSDGAISGETTPDMLFTKVIAAAINEDGKLVVGDEISDQIIAIDIPTGTTSPYAMGDVSGGDITFGLDGRPYLATRTGNILYQIMPGPFNLMLGNTPNLVTGMATMADGTLLLSAKNANVLEVRDENGIDFGVTYDLIYEGETFFTNNGDLASGCANNQEDEDACPGIKYYYAASNTPGVPLGTVMEGVISGGNLVLSELFSVGFEAHMAANNESGELYIVDKNGTELRTYSTAGVLLNTWALELSQTIALAWNPLDGLIYVGSADQNAVFQVDPANGSTNLFASNMPVNGGDIVATPDGDLYLIERSNSGSSKLYNITSGLPVFIANVAPAINGAALTGSGGFIMAQGAGANQFHLYDQLGMATGLLSAVDEAGIALQLFDGDMASVCLTPNPLEPQTGECNASELIEFSQGFQSNGSAVAIGRSNPDRALGEPEETDAPYTFVTLGYGGYITLGFEGSVLNESGADFEVIETTFGNQTCEAYPEFADVYISQNGLDFFFAKTVCKQDNLVDIEDAGQNFTYVNYIKVVNNDLLTSSPDGFDLDGVRAIHNCIDQNGEDQNGALISYGSNANAISTQLDIAPNPTSGRSVVTFVPGSSLRTTLELYRMDGSIVSTLFNQDVKAGETYRVEFDASSLPGGVYLYRLYNEYEVKVERMILAK